VARGSSAALGGWINVSAALRNLDRWIYLMHQVHEARYYIGRADKLGHPHLWTSYEAILDFLSYFRSALNSYAKCFVSTGSGRIKLEGTALFSTDSAVLESHRRIMDLRHKYVSHSDSNEFEDVRVIEEASDDELVVRLEYNLSFPFDRLYELRTLIGVVENHVVDGQRKHTDGIAREIGKRVRVREGQ
jgi:hypothetical protein